MTRAIAGRRLLRVGLAEAWGRDRVVLFAIQIVLVLGFLGCLRAAGGSVDGWGLGFAAVGAAAMARVPETPVPLLGWGALLVWWALTVTTRFTWWALPAALVLLVAHTAFALAALGPRDGQLTRALVVRTIRRLLVVAGLVGLVALGCASLYAAQPPGYPVVVGAALLVVAGWLWLVGTDQDVPA